MKKSVLVSLVANNYIDKAKQLFSCAYWNAGWKGDYLLLAYEVQQENLEWFKEKVICFVRLLFSDFQRACEKMKKATNYLFYVLKCTMRRKK